MKCYFVVLEGVFEGELGMIDILFGKISIVEDGWWMVEDVKGKVVWIKWWLLM